MNHSKRARKRYFNVSSHKHDVKKSLTVKNISMTSVCFSGALLIRAAPHDQP